MASLPGGTFRPVPLDDVRARLAAVGLFPRDLHQHRDHAFTAIFSRLQPLTQEQRVTRLLTVDPGVHLLDAGFLADNGEPFIDFAFLTV